MRNQAGAGWWRSSPPLPLRAVTGAQLDLTFRTRGWVPGEGVWELSWLPTPQKRRIFGFQISSLPDEFWGRK